MSPDRPEVAFTPADLSHTELIVGLMREFYTHEQIRFDEPAARRALAQILGDERLGRVWLIEAAGEWAGYLVLTFGFSLEFQGRDAFVDELYLRGPHRGKGLGLRALELAEAHCRSRGLAAVHLAARHDNARALEVYRRYGFKDHDRYLLTKWLGG